MIRTTDNLRSDHAVVARGLAVLSAIGAHVRSGLAFPAADCALLLRFLREFVVGVYLHKNSTVLLPRVAMHGSDAAVQAVGDAVRVHDEIAELTHSLVLFWEPVADLSREECLGFAETVDAVVNRCRRLEKLDLATLLPAFDREVPPDDRLDCARECEGIERSRSSRQVWVERLDPLAARWLD